MIISNYLKVAIHDTATEGLVQQRFGNMAGFRLSLELVLYLQSPCLTEN